MMRLQPGVNWAESASALLDASYDRYEGRNHQGARIAYRRRENIIVLLGHFASLQVDSCHARDESTQYRVERFHDSKYDFL